MEKRAAKYRRISEDREGRELGIERQDQDLDNLAARRGLAIVGDYVDNDIGASPKSRKPRPGYRQLIADAKAGKFEIILAYTTGRLTRRPREHEDLIDLAVEYGIEFEYVRSPSFDLRTAQGRRVARTLAAQDAGESEEISERVSRDALRRAEKGENHGGRRAFGYTADGLHLMPGEAVELRRAADEVLRGTPLGSLVRELNERPLIEHLLSHPDLLDAHPAQAQAVFLLRHREGMTYVEAAEQLGIREDTARRLLNKLLRDQRDATPDVITYTTVTGRPWTPSSLRDSLRRPRLAGLSEHKGQVVGKGQWPAILTVEQHQAVRALLDDPSRRTTTGNRASHLLSGLALSECGAAVTSFGLKRSKGSPPRPMYRCRKDYCAAIGRDVADGYVIERVFERLTRPDALELLIDHDRPDMDALRDEAHALRVRLDEAAALYAAGTIDARQLTIINEQNRARLGEIERAQQHTSRAPILRDLIEAGSNIERVWDGMTLDRRRAVVQALMVVRIRKGGGGKRIPDLGRKIEITPKA